LIALDRMERGGVGDNLSERSAVEDFEREYAIPVLPVATVADLLAFLGSNADPGLVAHAAAVERYRRRYGV
jgi:orotate phosphoribosyltransferase